MGIDAPSHWQLLIPTVNQLRHQRSTKLKTSTSRLSRCAKSFAWSLILVGLGGFFTAQRSWAAVNSIGPFAGDHSEGFEGFFPRSVNAAGATNLDSQPIFGGIGSCAVVSTAAEAGIYQNTGSKAFNLGSSNAKVRGGTNGFASRSGSPGIVFNRPVFQFGGYFGSYNGAGGSSVQVTLFDATGGLIDQPSFSYNDSTGALVWQGWSSTTAISTVSFSVTTANDQFVMDDLTVNCNLPALSIRLLTNQVQITWPTNFTGYQLEQLTTLQAPFTNWSNVATPATNSGTNWQVALPTTNNSFFRLRYGP